MDNIYLISSGEYSDYGVCFLVKSPMVISEEDFRAYWLEAIKRKTEYTDNGLWAIAKYLGVAKQLCVYDYRQFTDADSWGKAVNEVGYEYKSEVNFFQEVLSEHGMSNLLFEEYNVDGF